jgi:hypothetical protein
MSGIARAKHTGLPKSFNEQELLAFYPGRREHVAIRFLGTIFDICRYRSHYTEYENKVQGA